MVQVSIVNGLEGKKKKHDHELRVGRDGDFSKNEVSVSRGQGYQAHRPQRESAGRSHRLKNRTWDIIRQASYREGRSQLPCPLVTRLPQSATSNSRERSPPAAGTKVLTRESVSPQKCLEVLY